MQIRRVRPDELDRVGAVTVAAYAEFGPHEEGGYVEQLRDAARRDREAEVWVAADGSPGGDEVLLGSVTVCPPGSPWREVSREDEGEFRMLAVDPAARGRGVGEALVRAVLDRFSDDGLRAVVLCSLDRMAAAHRLYGRLGFARLPERDWRPAPDIPLLAFGKELT